MRGYRYQNGDSGRQRLGRVQPYTFPSQLMVDLAKPAGPYKAGAQQLAVPAPPGLTYTPDFAEMAPSSGREKAVLFPSTIY